MVSEDLVKLPSRGKALIVTDLHGNLEDYHKVMDLWGNDSNKKDNLILTGDFIHAMGTKNDNSIEILESVRSNCKKYDNFHLLLGNHEWATITHTSVYKGGVNQSLNFEDHLKEKFGEKWKAKLQEYTSFLKKLPIAVKTSNGVFISHAWPPKGVKSYSDILYVTRKGYSKNPLLYEMLWNRYGDYDKQDIDAFLKLVGCKAMIVGHTPVKGHKLIQNQLIISSSYSKGKNAYVELDLEKEIKNGRDLKKMVKFFK